MELCDDPMELCDDPMELCDADGDEGGLGGSGKGDPLQSAASHTPAKRLRSTRGRPNPAGGGGGGSDDDDEEEDEDTEDEDEPKRGKGHSNKQSKPSGKKYHGVSWDKSHSKWRVQVAHDGVLYSLGRFPEADAVEGARLYDIHRGWLLRHCGLYSWWISAYG